LSDAHGLIDGPCIHLKISHQLVISPAPEVRRVRQLIRELVGPSEIEDMSSGRHEVVPFQQALFVHITISTRSRTLEFSRP